MSNKYFANFPLIAYGNNTIRNLVSRTAVFQDVLSNQTLFYPYTIKDGERADTLAYDYYGDSDLFWIIYLVNNIIDPYYDWPLSNEDFASFIGKKYESIPGVGDGVIQAQSTIAYYERQPITWYFNTGNNEFITATEFLTVTDPWNWVAGNVSNYLKVSVDSYPGDIPLGDIYNWLPIYAYDDEFIKNENKRVIKILDRQYAGTFVQALGKVFT